MRPDESNITGTVTEADLIDYLKNRAVHKLRIYENENGRYELRIQVSWKGGELQLITARKKAREWASLDRMVKHFKTAGVAKNIDWVILLSG